MKIDEAIKHYEDMKKGLYLVYPEELYDFTIATMRKYQKIEEIVNTWRHDIEAKDFKCMAEIAEVFEEDGEID